MSQEHDDMPRQTPSSAGPSPGMTISQSDAAFPSTLLMGACLILIVALVGVTGWKVLLLDQEREDIHQQRAVLERDINAFKLYGGELPQLEKRHGELTVSIASLEGIQRDLQQTIEKLTQQRQTLAEEAARLSGDNTELVSRINAVRKELGQAQSELVNARPLAATAKQELVALRSQETSLRASIAEKQKQATVLTADIQGLERSRAHAQELLARMTEDQKVLDGFKKSVDAMAMQLQASVTKANSASAEYVRQAASVQGATRSLDAELATMQARLQTMDSQIASLERHSATLSQILTQGGASAQAMQGQVQNLMTENKRLGTVLQALDAQVQQWVQHAQAPLAKITEMEEKLRPIANTLTDTVQTIAAQASALESQVGSVRMGSSDMQSAVGSLGQHAQVFARVASELQSGTRLNSENSEALSKLISQMQRDLNALSAAISALQTRKQTSSDNQ